MKIHTSTLTAQQFIQSQLHTRKIKVFTFVEKHQVPTVICNITILNFCFLRLFLCKALPRNTKGWAQCLVEHCPEASFTALKECRISLSGGSFSGTFFKMLYFINWFFSLHIVYMHKAIAYNTSAILYVYQPYHVDLQINDARAFLRTNFFSEPF